MAILKADISFNLEPLKELGDIFPELNARLLGVIGAKTSRLLKMNYLSGQDINLIAYPTDKKGRETIQYSINKRITAVTIGSYPMYLFERGRILRDGTKEPGKYTITKKLKMSVMSNLPRYVVFFENQILKNEIKKIGL